MNKIQSALKTEGNDMGKLITTARAAEIHNCTARYIRRLCQNGRLKCEQIGRDWLVDEDTVRALPPPTMRGKRKKDEDGS